MTKRKTMYCKICGNQVPLGNYRYCSDACAKIGQKSHHKKYRKKINAETRQYRTKPPVYVPKVSIREIVIKASEEGITYGEYVRRYDP